MNAQLARAIEHDFTSPNGEYLDDEIGILYLELLKRCLCRSSFEPSYLPLRAKGMMPHKVLLRLADNVLRPFGFGIVRPEQTTGEDRIEGRGWPLFAETMMGLRRLSQLQLCAMDLIRGRVPGDFMEAGCWRGGATILLLAVLAVARDRDRYVWAADSFSGYPAPNETSHDEDRLLYANKSYFAVSREEFERNVRRYDLLSDRLRILHGWFSETIPSAPLGKLSLVRIDVDGYESVRDVLNAAYPKLSPGGYVLVEDMRPPGARQAVEEFRKQNNIRDSLLPIDERNPIGVFWRKA